VARAALLLRRGQVVAFPTETVYGLGAQATNPVAVRGIFVAKGRPADNPLIVHVADAGAAEPLTRGLDDRARALMAAFWPGPLTLVLPKSGIVPPEVSGGLDTVGIRLPAHPVARALIAAAGAPVAAPSANRSGRPSPTTASHVAQDMAGRIPLILDGGPCMVGLESTVLDITGDVPVILRPGGVTREMLQSVLGRVAVDAAVLAPLEPGSAIRSPGMKYRHYAPRAAVRVVTGQPPARAPRLCALYDAALARGLRPVILAPQEHAAGFGGRACRPWGSADAPQQAASELFALLRALDEEGYDPILAEAVADAGIGLAVMNRLLRAAGFAVEQAEQL
jgi:L-threonylcarbamoyladenylate synthase